MKFIWILAIPLMMSCSAATEPEVVEGELQITTTTDPDPVIVGQNAFLITIIGADGVALEGAEISLDPQMTEHGHGSNEDVTVEELGMGEYRAFPVTFTMPGAWEVMLTVSHPKTDVESMTHLPFQVQ